MPNSLILSWLFSLFSSFSNSLKKSKVWKLFNNIYNKTSSAVMGSCSAKLLCKQENENESLTGKIFNFPLYILSFLCKLFYKPLNAFTQKSIFAYAGKAFYNGFAALNSKFLAITFSGMGISWLLCSLANKNFSFIALGIVILGLIIGITNINLIDHVKDSFLVSIFFKLFDFKNPEYKFYDIEYLNKKSTLVIGFITGLLSGVMCLVSPVLALITPFALFGILLVLHYPIVGVFVAVFAAPIIPTMLLALICLGTLFALFVNKSLSQDYKWKTSKLGTALILLLCILLVSSIFSFSPVKSLMVWAMYLVFFTFYFVIINTINSKDEFYVLLKAFVLSGTIVSVIGILQYIFNWTTDNLWIDEAMFDTSTMRAYSTLENPNVLGEYLLLLLPVTYMFMIRQNAKSFAKFTYILIFIATVACLIFTQSRGCWLGLLLSIAIIVSFHCGKLWALIPIFIAVMPLILPQTIIERLSSIGNMSDTSTSYRVFIWYGTMNMLKTFFIGGIGMGEGAFSVIYPTYGYNAIIAPHSHNLFLQLTVEAGIGALIIFIAAMFIFIRNNALICKASKKTSRDYLTALTFTAGVSGFLLQSMFDYTFYNYRVMAIFIMYLAFGAVLKNLKKEAAE